MPVFDTRNPNCGIIKTSDFDAGQGLSDLGITDARNVILHCDKQSVFVRAIRASKVAGFTGIVSGFEPADQQVGGLAKGDEVFFEEHHVISMGS
ncbi:hypothetical protein G3480_20045 [Thiorhodococcus mannitoliphagus]|uniref:Uncharacterized protein n=1 Tax=Thiorhodococcus mannitoliphagus TaxID=329406 RepID=A0A6P1DXZ3_9GAMM|nr:hypothetical protein [Thiorhodococcus mannitoliphagus]NEX22569.1 hypothetical protein [Thiorhodococcus mannitoliphagus]